jgi:hypothetical protein
MVLDDDDLVSRAYVTSRGAPKLVHSAVLFVDLLGVREMNRGPKRDVRQNLVKLDRALNGMYRNFLEPGSPWPASMFSDTLVLASPVLPHSDEEVALGGLIIQAAWLQLNFMAEGLFLRGALALGDFHIRDRLIFGPALVNAAELEHDVAVHPRIVLSRESEKSQQSDLQHYFPPEDSPQNNLLLRDGDGWTFINYLALLFDEPTDPRPALVIHRDQIQTQLAKHKTRKRVWEKYRWVAEYHNNVVADRLPGEPNLLIRAAQMTWGFASFV